MSKSSIDRLIHLVSIIRMNSIHICVVGGLELARIYPEDPVNLVGPFYATAPDVPRPVPEVDQLLGFGQLGVTLAEPTLNLFELPCFLLAFPGILKEVLYNPDVLFPGLVPVILKEALRPRTSFKGTYPT